MIKATNNSMKQASELLEIPIKHLKIIKSIYPDGFNKNNSVNTDLVRAYYEENKELIISKEQESIETLKKEKLSNDIILQQIEIAKAKRRVIEMGDVKSFLQKLGIEVGSLLMARLVKELPNQIDRVEADKREDLCKDAYNSIVDTMNKSITEWCKENKV